MTHFVIYDEIDEFVTKQPNMVFEGWDVLVDRRNHAGWMRKAGVQKSGTWYTRQRVSCNAKGVWEFEDRDVVSVNPR
jgi:hypothetical protein